MNETTDLRGSPLSAILIAPNRALASQLMDSAGRLGAFDILLDLKSYPAPNTLDIRVRQLQPAVVLLDVDSSLDNAIELIAASTQSNPGVSIVALDTRSDSATILRVLRTGASEFLFEPFEPANTAEAVERLARLQKPKVETTPEEMGRICAFSSVKPGSGASTLAAQTAFSLKRVTSQRVLLVDLDLTGGTLGFSLKLDLTRSTLDALRWPDTINASAWMSLVSSCHDLDILPAPLVPHAEAVDADRIQAVLDYARTMYEWIVVDLPVSFHRTSLLAISQADMTLLVSTSELPSLHLARKAVTVLGQLGFPKDRFHVVVNRAGKRDGIKSADMEKLFGSVPFAVIPNDYMALHRTVMAGMPLSGGGELSGAIENLAARLTGGSRARGIN